MPWFSPPDVTWTYASRKLIAARLLASILPLGLLAAGVLIPVAQFDVSLVIPIVAIVVFVAWCVWVMVRQVTAHAWVERQDDLVVKRGRIFRRVTVVPYGRMQYVEVAAGPIARSLGLARVQLHTASPGTDAHLSGVPAAEAARLRDRLTERGEATLAGL